MKLTRRSGLPVTDQWRPEAWREAMEFQRFDRPIERIRLVAAVLGDLGVMRSLRPELSRN